MTSGRPIKCVVVGNGKFLAIRQISTLICSMYKGEGEGGGESQQNSRALEECLVWLSFIYPEKLYRVSLYVTDHPNASSDSLQIHLFFRPF